MEVELDAKSDSLGESHAQHACLLSIMDFPHPYCRFVDQYIEPYSNAWESKVLKMKVHEKALHAKIKSSSNPVDSLHGCLLPEV